ncbi:unnamed protein product [Blepharisma stoltei]|uniref:Translin-associated factor X-interacting protein 1 N-terminal domain-containing protein n=1 Tax=Blepharisma stoltei TaxID=1481888 RepID=A0AAU9IX50_9CILI|nr:unnamed protein product [Blepharisma stoltei]
MKGATNQKKASPMKKRIKNHYDESSAVKVKKSHKSLIEKIHNTTITAPSSTNASFNINPYSIGIFSRGCSPEALTLELKLTEKLRELSLSESDSVMTQSKYEVVKEIFDEVVNRDVSFGPILLKIRDYYDLWITNLQKNDKPANIDDFLRDVTDMKQVYQQDFSCLKFMTKEIERLARENGEIAKDLNEKSQKCEEIEERLKKISSVNVDFVSKDIETWKFIVSENRAYENLIAKLKKQLNKYKYKEQKLMELVIALKNHGYPVEEIYNKEIRNPGYSKDEETKKEIFDKNTTSLSSKKENESS